jgi:hypothetical protein
LGLTAKNNMKGVFALQLLSCLMMTGVIWLVQLVHYPLFAGVGAEGFVEYERLHTLRIGWLVMPLMLLELGTAIWLLQWQPVGIPPSLLWVALALLGVVWLNTMLQAVPLHGKLSQGFDLESIQQLVRINWIRTVAWTLRSGILVGMVWRLMGERT